MNIKSKVVALATALTLSGVAVVAPFAAVADHTTAHTIEQLTAQIAALQAQLVALAGGSTSGGTSAGACSFTRDLTVGARGDDVKCLQDYLTSTGHYSFSGGSTGYFGPVTRNSTASWQGANNVAPAVGYFGPLSRAKYNAVAGTTTGGGTTGGTTGGGTTAVGSGLTVSAAVDQPPSDLLVESAARASLLKLVLTASSDGDVTVKGLTVDRRGLADDSSFDGILLIDSDGNQIGLTKTLSSDHKVNLNESFVVKAGTSKTVVVAANMAADLDQESGQVPKFALTAVDAGTATVNGVLPIEGNSMTINSTLAIGSVTMSVGSLDPGAANTKNVGTKGYNLSSVKASVGSAENVTFESIRFNQAGSAASADLANVKVKAGDKEYDAAVTSDGKYYIASFPGGVKVAKGGNLEFTIKADLVNGSARTVDMDLLRKADIVVKGDVFGRHILAGGGSAGAASAGAFSSNQEPYFNAFAATIDKGSLLVSSSNKVAAGNVPIDVNDTVIGAFLMDVKGEPMQISSFTLNFVRSGTGTGTDVVSVKLTDSNGAILAGPKDGTTSGITFTDTWTLPVGENHVFVKGKLDTTFVSNDTLQVTVDPDGQITAKGQTTGLSITANPTSNVAANTQTVKGAALGISVEGTPFGQNVVRGVNGFHFATYVFDAGSSGEDARVTSIQLRDTVSATGVVDELNSCVLYDGATALNTGSDVINPDDPASGTTDDTTFTLTNNLIVPKGTVKKIDLKCNISSSATADSTHSWGTNAAAANVNSVGAGTGASITESITTSTGSRMVIKTAGSFTVNKDSSAPSASLVLSGKTDVPMNVLKFHATDEAVSITELTLHYSTSTASSTDFSKVTLWDGATKIGEATWAGTALNATSTFSAPFIVPKDADKLLTIKADLATISVTASTTAGRLLAIDYNGTSSSTGIGQSSGQKLGSLNGVNTDAASMQIMKTLPTVAKIAVPSTSLPQTDAILYRFSVSADAAGPVALYKLTFSVSSSSVSATSSNFRVFAYTDSGFSVKAYENNPTHADNVDCIALSNLDRTSGCDAVAVTDIDAGDGTGGGAASSTEVVWFFGPKDNTSSTTEAVVIPAGGTRYFELRGDITNPGSGTGNTVQVSLLGDAARVPQGASGDLRLTGTGNFHDAGRGRLATAAEVAVALNNDFVWSPMSTTTSLTGATSTTDWTNGFLIPGLPSTNLSANTFSN